MQIFKMHSVSIYGNVRVYAYTTLEHNCACLVGRRLTKCGVGRWGLVKGAFVKHAY